MKILKFWASTLMNSGALKIQGDVDLVIFKIKIK